MAEFEAECFELMKSAYVRNTALFTLITSEPRMLQRGLSH